MRFAIFCFSVFICLIGCSNNKSVEKTAVVEIYREGQFFDMEQKIVARIANFKRIAFNGDARLYIVPVINLGTKETVGKDGNPNVEVTKRDTSYIIYAFNKGDKRGFQYDYENFRTVKGTVIDADSLIKSLRLREEYMPILNIDIGKPIDVNKKNDFVVEKFAFTKEASSDPDSIYRFYDKRLKDIDFTFSKKLDLQANSKLFRTLIIYNKVEKGKELPDIEIPRRVSEYKMTRIIPKDINRLEEIFAKFKQDQKNLSVE